MAGQKIKGITIEIGSDIKGLSAGLSSLNSSSKKLENELKSAEKALKLNPSSVELLTQKQELLTQSVDSTEKKLEALKRAKKKADADMENGTEINQEQYRKLQREIVFTEEKLDNLTKASKEFGSVSSQQVAAFGDKMQEAGGKIEVAGQKMAGISTVAGAAAGALIGVGYGAAQASDDINTMAAQTGLAVEEIQKYRLAADLIDVSAETVAGAMAKLTKNMGTAQKGTGDAALAFDALGITITNSSGELRNNEEVFQETMNVLAGIENETQRDAYAMAIFGKSAQDLNPLILGGADALKTMGEEWEQMGIIMSQEELDGLNEFNDEVDLLKAQAKGTFMAVGAEIAEAFLPVLQQLSGILSGAMERIRGLDSSTLGFITTVLGIVAAIGPVLMIGGKLISGIGTLLSIAPKVVQGLGLVKAAIAAIGGPVTIVIAAVAGLALKLIHTYKTSEEFRNKVNGAFEAVKSKISEVIQSIKTFIDGMVEKITGMGTIIKEKFMALPGELKEIGKNIISGLWEGISSKIEWVRTKIGEFADSIPQWVRDKLGIHSPSREFAEIGAYTIAGFVQGIEENRDDAKAVMEKAVNLAVEELVKGESSEENKEKIRKLGNDLIAEYSEGISKGSAEITDEFKEAINGLVAEYEAVVSELERKQEAMSEKLASYGTLFGTETTEDGKTEYAVHSLQSYIDTLDEYATTMEELRARGLSEGLLDEISNMSVDDALGYGNELLEMSDKSFEEYSAKWEEYQEKAVEIGTKFYQSEIDTLANEFNDKINKELSVIKETTFLVGADSIKAMINGLKSRENELYAKAQGIADTIRSIISSAFGGSDDSDGSHRTGLREVPFDGYRAILHRGEMVLTQQEADRYEGGNPTVQKGGGDVYVTQKIYSPTPDARATQKAAVRQFRKLALEV